MAARASWQPDPTQRHQYRWWDGAAWTDTVADDGRPATDPLDAVPRPVASGRFVPVLPAEAEPMPTGTGGAAANGGGTAVDAPATAPSARVIPTFDPNGARFAAQPAPKRRRFPIWKWITTLMIVTALAAAALVMWNAREKDEPAPVTAPPVAVTGEIAEAGGAVGRTFSLKAGQAARLRVEVPADLVVDAYVRKAADDGEGAKVLDLCCDDGSGFVTGKLAVDDDVTYQLVVVSREGTGEARMIIEILSGTAAASEASNVSDASDLLDDPFFSDSGFFSDAESYTP